MLSSVGSVLADRLLYRLARRPLEDAEVRRRCFHIVLPEHRRSIEAIGRAFLEGYNLSLRYRDPKALRLRLLAQPRLLRPFAFEGAAMGFGLRASFRWGAHLGHFERFIQCLGREYLYLYYVGLGWWLHVRFRDNVPKLWRSIRHLDPRYRPLCLDGYGFKLGFFHYLQQPELLVKTLAKAQIRDQIGTAMTATETEALEQGEDLAPFVVQGWGRSLWFLYRDDEESRRRALHTLPADLQGDAWAGWGLAAAFTQIECPQNAIRLWAEGVPLERQGDVLLGMIFAWTAWSRCDPGLFQERVSTLPPLARKAVETSVVACRRALMRAQREHHAAEGNSSALYRAWRRHTQEAAEKIWLALKKRQRGLTFYVR